MKIANVIFEEELVNHSRVDYVNYINESKTYDEVCKRLPTLYVGWNFMKSCNPENEVIQNADILKKKIVANELYWECSFQESKASHVKGIDNFIKQVPSFYFMPRYTYINLDPVFFLLKDVQDLMDVLPKKIDRVYHYKNEMLYVLVENKITGINLKMYDFFQFDTNEIITKVRDRIDSDFGFYHTDPDGETFQKYYKILPNFTHLRRYIITLLSK